MTEPSSRPRKGAARSTPPQRSSLRKKGWEEDPLIEECYRKSVELLLRNSSPHGVYASASSPKAEGRNYRTVFGRDASICALGMVASGESRLLRAARAGLVTLARFQAKNGQIPNYVRPEKREATFWHFGCIDSTLWWLVSLDWHDRFSGDRKLLPALAAPAEKAISWLRCQEQPIRNLLVQNEASDWADIMPRSGHVLYSNALWYRVKKRYRLSGADRTKDQFNRIFFPFSSNGRESGDDRFYTIGRIRKEVRPTSYYLSFVSYLSWGEDIDLYGNALALLFGLPEEGLHRKILRYLKEVSRNGSYPVPVTLNPIRKGSRQWREYMGRHNLNAPYQYHNGGVWPYAGCFWAMALAKEGETKLAVRELRNIAALNRVNHWQFNEWFHGKTGRPMGMPGQSWNASMFLLAYHSLRDGLTI
ncbi:MAG TPA: glycoside hydrolase 100 family protein [Candidatus Deferrimicrobiaceae bacterium]|nr:glycoside hydrolase 100 family protein [Candidatus Deferrimicrobiaceae bacterium]